MTLRVAIVEDQELMRAAFRTILESHGVVVVGEAADGDEAVELVRTEHPDVVLMDVRMPGRDGVEATAIIATDQPDSKVLILMTFDDDDVLRGALAAGASGFLLKNSTPEALVGAIHQVAGGDSVLDAAVAERVFTGFTGGAVAGDTKVFGRLTEREKDVLRLMCDGLTNAEIANRLDVEESTAKTHVSRVLTKLGVRDRVQAVILAYESGFVP